MSLFKKLFNLSQKPLQPQHSAEEDEQSKYMPERKDLPVDERFIHHFTAQGGRFLYCLNQDEVNSSIEQIIQEHNWIGAEVFCPDNSLKERLSIFNLDLDSNCSQSEILISTCEYVIADSGALLFSSNQVKQYKTHELPDNYIILASTSQIVESIGEGLRGIKVKNQSDIPTNITTLKHFRSQDQKEVKDLMNYGAAHKVVYLILLEDL